MENFSGKFLIAVPGLEDPNFKHTVVLICEHSREGAFGVVVNRILMESYMPLLKTFQIESSVVDMPIYYGGPVKPEQGYVVYWPYNAKYGAMRISGDLAVTASREILNDIASGNGPEKYLLALGFSGWSANQLDEELMMDSWLTAPIDNEIIFDIHVKERWKRAAGSIGVDMERYCNRSGLA